MGILVNGIPVAGKGKPGKDGKSAYKQAIDGGYTGTEEEFIKQLSSSIVVDNGIIDAKKARISNVAEGTDTTDAATIAQLTARIAALENKLTPKIESAQSTANDANAAAQKANSDLSATIPNGGTSGQVLSKASDSDRDTAWKDTVGRSMAGQTVEPAQGAPVTAGEGAEVFNDYRERKFNSSGYPAQGNVASGSHSHAEGYSTTASGLRSHAEGSFSTTSGEYSHAEGNSSKASGYCSHSEGGGTTASGYCSHSEGASTTASGYYSHSEGYVTTASGNYSHAGGRYTIAAVDCQTAIGDYNVKSTNLTDRLVIGKGNSENARANCFRVCDFAVLATGPYQSTGADYAELFEWADGNLDNEDRAGRFVTLDGEKIRLAGPGDGFILGIVSGNPSVVGDVHDDQWAGMYLYDIFGRPLWEDVEVPALERPDPTDPEKTVTVIPAHRERRQKLNPAYDSAQPYRPRTQRPEWDAVGMLGKLVAVDDGTCQVNGWCAVGEGGAATHSAERTRCRVMARLDESHIRVLIL